MNLNQLRVFFHVSSSSSITAAARELRISQPAASRQLSELETALGTRLVERQARGVELTAAGRLLARYAGRLFGEEHAAEEALAEFLGLRSGTLSVGASTTIGNYLVPAIFGRMRQDFPQVELHLEIGNTAHIEEALLAGRLDVGLTEGLVQNEVFDTEIFGRDEIVLIVNPGHRWAGRHAIAPRELQELSFIFREEGSGTRDVVSAALAEAGIQVKPIMTLGSTEAVKNAVERGLGVAMVSRLTVNLELESGRLAVLPVQDVLMERELARIAVGGRQQSPAATEFLRRLARAD